MLSPWIYTTSFLIPVLFSLLEIVLFFRNVIGHPKIIILCRFCFMRVECLS